MKILKTLLFVVLGCVALAVIVGFLLPRTAHVERSTVIDAPPATVFALVDGFGRFNEWSPWAEIDPEGTETTIEGPAHGVGAKMSWFSPNPKVGSGSQEIVASEPYSEVRTHLDFGDQGTADAFFLLAPEGEGTKVTWGFDTDFGNNLIGRYLGAFMFESAIGSDYEKGLANLKKLAETMPGTDWSKTPIEVVDTDAMPMAYVSGSSTQDPEAIGAALGAAYGKVTAYLAAARLEQAGPPFAIATKWEDNRYEFEAGIPYSGTPRREPRPSDGVALGTTPAAHAVKAIHIGPYESLAGTYEAIEAWAAVHGETLGHRPWEVYVSDPTSTPEAEVETWVYFPLSTDDAE